MKLIILPCCDPLYHSVAIQTTLNWVDYQIRLNHLYWILGNGKKTPFISIWPVSKCVHFNQHVSICTGESQEHHLVHMDVEEMGCPYRSRNTSQGDYGDMDGKKQD